MSRPFDGEERKGAVIALTDAFSAALNDPINKMVALALVSHLRTGHGYTPEDAVKLLVAMESEALRAVADHLEERTVEFLSAVKTT